MNINLVSNKAEDRKSGSKQSVDNGHSYQIRFKEDIIIPENSKVHLNYASLSRDSEIEFFTDQTVNVIVQNDLVYPDAIPATFASNTVFATGANSFVLQAGVYSYQRLQKKIGVELDTLLQQGGNVGDLGFYRAVQVSDLVKSSTDVDAFDLTMGIVKKDLEQDDFTHHATHAKNAGTTGGNAYVKTSADATTGVNSVKAKGSGADITNMTSCFLRTTDGTANRTAGTYATLETTALTGTGTGLQLKVVLEAITGGPATCEAPLPLGGGDIGGLTLRTTNVPQSTDHTTGTYNNVPIISTNGGTGGEMTVVVDGAGTGKITSVQLTKRGKGYGSGEICRFIAGTGIGGTDNDDVVITLHDKGLEVIADAGSVITEKCGGTGYAVGDTFKIKDGDIGGTNDAIYTVQALGSNSDVAFFDSYAMSAKTFWFNGLERGVPVKNCNIISAVSSHTLAQLKAQNACIGIGLYSQELADGIVGKQSSSKTALDGDPLRRISGSGANCPSGEFANPMNLPISSQFTNGAGVGKQLALPVQVCVNCRGGTARLEVWKGSSKQRTFPLGTQGVSIGNGDIHTAKSSLLNINSLKRLSSKLMDRLFPDGDAVHIGLETYRAEDEATGSFVDEQNLYWRILNLGAGYDPEKSVKEQDASFVLFDSKTKTNSFFVPDYFKCQDPAVLDYTEGGVSAVSKTTAGTADKTNGAKTDILITTTSGDGEGLKVSFTVVGGAVPDVIIATDCGHSYKVGDTFTIPNNQGVGGVAPDTVFTITANSGVKDGVNTRKNKYNSQQPFNAVAFSDVQNTGWGEIHMPSYTKVDAKPITFLSAYQFQGTDEVSSELNIPTATDVADIPSAEQLYYDPNTNDVSNPHLLHLTDFNLDWRNQSYSILIEELPLHNYKNTEKQRSGGFKKNILANVPAPFSNGLTFKTSGGGTLGNQRITSTYQPNFQITSNMYNQQFATNHFKVEILKQNTDKPATEIKNSVINFTIEPPDDYTGNFSTVSGLRKM